MIDPLESWENKALSMSSGPTSIKMRVAVASYRIYVGVILCEAQRSTASASVGKTGLYTAHLLLFFRHRLKTGEVRFCFRTRLRHFCTYRITPYKISEFFSASTMPFNPCQAYYAIRRP